MHTRNAVLVLPALLLFGVSRLFSQGPITVSQNKSALGAYGLYELTISHDDAPYANKWEAVKITCPFIHHPTGDTLVIYGFYYDTDTWKVRFAPPAEGTWDWTLSFETHSGVLTKTGSFTCTGSERKGFLKRHPANPYRIVYADGSLFDGIGLENCQGTALTYSIDGTPNHSLDGYAATFRQAGFNLYRWTIDNCSFKMWDTISTEGNRYLVTEGKAGDRLIQTLWQHGFRIYIGVFGFFVPYPACTWDYGTYFNPAQQAAVQHYLTYMVARYGAYTDIWELMNECSGRTDWINLMAAHLRSLDPYHRMITTSWEKAMLASIDIGSPHLYCYWDPLICDSALIAGPTLGFKKQKNIAPKPVIYGEFGNYPMNWDPTSALRLRIQAWTAFFYEISLIYWETSYAKTCQCNNIYLGAEEWPVIKALTDFTGDVHSDVVMCSLAQTTAGIRSYGLAGGNMLLGYFHHYTNHTQNVNAALTADLPGSGRLFWYDPLTGDTLAQQNVAAGTRTLTSPAFKIDCALKVILDSGTFTGIRDRAALVPTTPPIRIFSSPVRNTIKVTGMQAAGIKKIQLYNAAGSLVKKVTGTASQTVEYFIAGLPGGIYFMKICDMTGNQYLHKIIIFP